MDIVPLDLKLTDLCISILEFKSIELKSSMEEKFSIYVFLY